MCLKEPDLNQFSAQEISILDKVIVELQNKSAKQISNQTHDELWNSIERGKIMPLESVFLQDIIPATPPLTIPLPIWALLCNFVFFCGIISETIDRILSK